MPEVIEIRKYSIFLKKYMKNKKLKNIKILKGRYNKHGVFPLYDKIKKYLPLKIIDIKTKGKFLYFILENGFYIYSTLGLNGGWVYYNNKTKKYIFPKLIDYVSNEKRKISRKKILNHLNIELTINGGKIYYFDILSFGTMKVVNTNNNLNKKLKSLAPDIMDLNTTFDIFEKQILQNKYKDKSIGIVLMDQKMISGIGNYLRSDILWLSRINPYKKVSELTNKELKLIYKNAKLLTWGDYDFNEALKLKIIKKSNKLPKDYNRNFFVYSCDYDIYGNIVLKEPLHNSREKRFIYWVPTIQK